MIHDMESFGYFLIDIDEESDEGEIADQFAMRFSLKRPEEPFATVKSVRELISDDLQ